MMMHRGSMGSIRKYVTVVNDRNTATEDQSVGWLHEANLPQLT
jgi:hypothetical protein